MDRTAARELIERFLAAFNRGDHDEMLSCLSEDVVHDINENGREIGKDKFRWFLATRRRHYREEVSDIVVMVAEDGNRAAAEFTLRGTYLATAEGLPEANGQSYSLSGGAFFEIDDGLISRTSSYYSLAGWISQISD
ncbi:steroid delta-isomerase-like uncharacterized protein [Mesorhizobium sp. J18]|uniref:ketosteroid isomerase-related protein n=1 Tax=Mesorhizobium sp. J18 TaxID=935263 RepID=UPI001198EACB|nr:ketosteroid isomerase-related protein [Mesorhizobium sp. J18]TWG92929.1 steroid delta-isomerase-like uncharacterized protein [Mesorhizobium sp. J18]